ncbi:MAG: FtsW/RodA/SpoVE family cell cycle protein [Adlercreutzia sp.]
MFRPSRHRPYGRGYNLKQAQIAIGRGACSARACSRERSIRWASCPRLHRFIFCVLAEELGF